MAETKPEKKALLSKRERWLKLAPARTNQVLKALKRLRNCNNKAQYESTPEEINEMMTTLSEAFDDTAGAFIGGIKSSSDFAFTEKK